MHFEDALQQETSQAVVIITYKLLKMFAIVRLIACNGWANYLLLGIVKKENNKC